MSGMYTVGGAALRFTEAGVGLPVIFLHPTPLDHHYWQPLVAKLTGVGAIVPDLRGHGTSELGPNLPIGLFARVPDAPVLTMEQLAADVLALLDLLGIKTAVFAGCSVGGYVLLELWRQAPQRMRGLAFICSKPQPDAEPALAKRAENIARVRSNGPDGLSGLDGFFDTMAQTLIGATARAQSPALVVEARALMTLTAEAVVAVQAGLAMRPDSVPTVRTIRVPVLSIAGGEDGSVSPADMEAFGEASGGCESHVIPDAGHFAAFEQPQTIAQFLEPWLKQFAG
jgi:3-oxoadipate enol-lactonase